MTGRRQSARLASQSSQTSQPPSFSELPPQRKASSGGRKRKNETTGTSPSAKRGKTNDEPEQKTLEETFSNGDAPVEKQDSKVEQNGPDPHQTPSETTQPPEPKAESNGAIAPNGTESQQQDDVEMTGTNGQPEDKGELAKDAEGAKPEQSEEVKTEPAGTEPSKEGGEETSKQKQDLSTQAEDVEPAKQEEKPAETTAEKPGDKLEEAPAETTAEKPADKPGETPTDKPEDKPAEKPEEKSSSVNGNAVIPDARQENVPSTILEKGVIYFFFRARVNTDHPHDVNDIARSYMIMRPLPLDAKLGDGPIGDDNNCRLLALPKKVLPLSGKDRFMTFVEKVKTNFKDLKESFMSGSDYATQTAGTSHSPPVTPVAEGIYAITSTGRESHLAYILTVPSELGEVQKDLGLRPRGSFVTSVKNPTASAPNNASLPKGADYPQDILDEFRGLRWKPLEPKFLDYENTQFLVIGESFDHATEQRPKDDRENNELPEKELERLEGEDEIRVKHLKGDDAVFADLGITTKEFPNVPSTW